MVFLLLSRRVSSPRIPKTLLRTSSSGITKNEPFLSSSRRLSFQKWMFPCRWTLGTWIGLPSNTAAKLRDKNAIVKKSFDEQGRVIGLAQDQLWPIWHAKCCPPYLVRHQLLLLSFHRLEERDWTLPHHSPPHFFYSTPLPFSIHGAATPVKVAG